MDEKINELEVLTTGQRTHLNKCISENGDEKNARHGDIILGAMSYTQGLELALSIAKGEKSQTIEDAIKERQEKMKKDKEENPQYYKQMINPFRGIIHCDNQFIWGLMTAQKILL